MRISVTTVKRSQQTGFRNTNMITTAKKKKKRSIRKGSERNENSLGLLPQTNKDCP